MDSITSAHAPADADALTRQQPHAPEQQGAAQPCEMALDVSCLGPPFNPESALMYGKLTTKGQLVTIAGETGVGKSLLAQNCAVHTIQNGGHVVWINCDMSPGIVHDRMRCILTDSPMAGADGPQLDAKARQTIVEMGAGHHWLVAPLTPKNDLRLEGIIDQGILMQEEKTRIVVVDGFDRLYSGPDAHAFDEQCTRLSTLAAERKICIIITSQCVRDACGHEIVGADDLAYSMGKANAASLVVTIGRRSANLLTVAVVKDRAALFRDQQVFRLQIEPSLRLTAAELIDAIRLERADSEDLAFECVNCQASDLGLAGDADDSDDDDQRDSPHSGARLYHGNAGFVGIGRGIFESAMYRTMQFEDLGRLLSLYEMAAISSARLYAPATRIPVIIKRGQIMTSLQILANYWKTSKKQVERFLARAEQEGLIRVQRIGPDGQVVTTNVPINVTPPRTLATVITLCHYDGNDGAKESFGDKSVTTNVPTSDPIPSRPRHDPVTTLSRPRHTTEQA